MNLRRAALVLLPSALFLAGCNSSGADPAPTGAAAPGTVRVVTSTNVYAAIVSAIGGDRVNVTPILDDPAVDPHSFEASPKQQVLINEAALVVANGGGYDDFAAQMAEAAPSKPVYLSAVEVAGADGHDDSSPTESAGPESQSPSAEAGHEGHDHSVNEHVFYDLPAMDKLAAAVANELSQLQPAGKELFAKNATSFTAELEQLQARAAALKTKHPNISAIVTEPVANLLLEEMRISDATPQGFAAAVENETDPAAKDVADVDDALTGKRVQLLVVNAQTAGPVTNQVKKVAATAGIPVIEVTETLPAGVTSYVDWIASTIDAVEKSLGA